MTEETNQQPVKAYKGFDKNFQCRGFQFTVGQEYSTGGEIQPCRNGFHACENPVDVFEFYNEGPVGRWGEVEQSGIIKKDGNKLASSVLKITAEISFGKFLLNAILINFKKTGHAEAIAESVKLATADGAKEQGHSSAAGEGGHSSAAGNYGHSSAAGNYGHSSAAGYKGHSSAAGNYGHSSAAGNYGHSSAAGQHAVAVAMGNEGWVKGAKGNPLVLVLYNKEGKPVRAVAEVAGKKGIKADTWYRLNGKGKFTEVVE